MCYGVQSIYSRVFAHLYINLFCVCAHTAGRTTVNTRSSKQAAGGTRADSKLQHLEDTQPVGKKRAGKSSVLPGTTTCNYKLYF